MSTKKLTKTAILRNLLFGLLLIITASIFVYTYSIRHTGNVRVGLGAFSGDVDGNGFVDLTDWSLLSNTFGKQLGDPQYDARADFNGSNTITIIDFQAVSNNFGL